MIDHISVGVSDLERSARFYEATLAPFGLSRLVARPATVGFGKAYPEFWINLRSNMAPVEQAVACTSAFGPNRPARSMRSMRLRSMPEAAPTARPACVRTTGCAITRRSSLIPTAIASRR